MKLIATPFVAVKPTAASDASERMRMKLRLLTMDSQRDQAAVSAADVISNLEPTLQLVRHQSRARYGLLMCTKIGMASIESEQGDCSGTVASNGVGMTAVQLLHNL